jgi:hypothetical protein
MKPLLLALLFAGLFSVAALTSGRARGTARADACQLPQVFGDMSGDHAVQAYDALYVLRDVAKMVNIGSCAPLGVDCNSSVTAVDALKILRYVANMPYLQRRAVPDIGTVIGIRCRTANRLRLHDSGMWAETTSSTQVTPCGSCAESSKRRFRRAGAVAPRRM